MYRKTPLTCRGAVASVAAVAALSAFAGQDVGTAEITIGVNGGKPDVRLVGSFPLKPLTPYRIEFEAMRPDGTGGTVCVGLPSLNLGLPLKGTWKSYTNIVASASDVGGGAGKPLRLTSWDVPCDVLVRNWRVTELAAIHAAEGALTLGEGELLLGNRYSFRDAPESVRHNHSRPLAKWKGASLNEDRYPFWTPGGEIVWRHDVGGRKFLSGNVSFSERYSSGGKVLASVSNDGEKWIDIGSVTCTNTLSHADIPQSPFPCETLFVRLKCVEGGVQISSYSLDAEVDGEPMFAIGATRYVEADRADAAEPPPFTTPEYYRTDYGELLPGSDDGLAVWRASSGWKIPKNRPVPTDHADGIEVGLAANETEAIQLVLTPSAAFRNVAVTIEIPSLSVEVLREVYLHVDDPVDSTAVRADYPDPLPPLAAGMEILAGENCPFWIRVKAPKGTPPGVYRGIAVVRGERVGEYGGRFEKRIPISATIFGFELPDTMTCRTLFGFGDGFVSLYHGLAAKEDRLRVIGEYMRLMSDYHLSPYYSATYGRKKWSVEWNGDEPVFDWGEWDEGVEEGFSKYNFNAHCIITGLGIGHSDCDNKAVPQIGGVKEGDPRYGIRLARLLKGVQDHIEEKGWLDRTYIYAFDEPPQKFVPYVTNGLAKLERHAPKLRRFVVSPCRKELVGGVQTWCCLPPQMESALARERRELGDDFWLYVCTVPRAPYATEFIDHPGVELRTWLWQAWGEKATGVLVWHSNLWNEKAVYPDKTHPQNPYVDPQSWTWTKKTWGNGDGRFLYPPESVFEDVSARDTKLNPGPNFDKPVGSTRAEMLRDGIEDYEYFAILQKLDPQNPLLAVPAEVSRSLSDFSKSPAPLEAHRMRVAREIERLRRKRK